MEGRNVISCVRVCDFGKQVVELAFIPCLCFMHGLTLEAR